MTLVEAKHHIAHAVVYRPKHGPAEQGTITGCGSAYVFVRYSAAGDSKATRPEDLELLGASVEAP